VLADVNARDNFGQTPLQGVAWRGHADIVTLFLGYGADPHIKDKNGDAPLDVILEQARSGQEKQFLDLVEQLKISYPEQVVEWWMRAGAAT
jgi:ankyrin repeat protein